MGETMKKCNVCGVAYEGYGNSTWGLWNIDEHDVRGELLRCCDKCNREFVVPARMGLIPRKDITGCKW